MCKWVPDQGESDRVSRELSQVSLQVSPWRADIHVDAIDTFSASPHVAPHLAPSSCVVDDRLFAGSRRLVRLFAPAVACDIGGNLLRQDTTPDF
jgi:hypothetical protein